MRDDARAAYRQTPAGMQTVYLIWNKSMKSSFEQILICLLTYLIAGFFWGCEETVKKSANEAFDAAHEKEIDSGQDSSLSYIFVDSVRALTEINPEIFPFNGRFCTSVSWNDKLGGNIFIISEQGKYDKGNGRKEVFAYHYVKRDTSNEMLWQMDDFVDGWGCDLNIQLINIFPLISDIDSNGIAETAIFYSLDNRCDAVPFPAKLIVHEGEEKFSITGIRNQFLGPPEDLNNEYRTNDGLPPMKYKILDRGSSALDSSIINFYSRQWDNFITLENKLNGALPDSLINTMN